jgi:hypothetical protein
VKTPKFRDLVILSTRTSAQVRILQGIYIDLAAKDKYYSCVLSMFEVAVRWRAVSGKSNKLSEL